MDPMDYMIILFIGAMEEQECYIIKNINYKLINKDSTADEEYVHE